MAGPDDPIDIPELSEEKRQELMAEYPEWALYLDDPEILEILLWAQGEAEVVDPTIVEARIRQTSWWQDNADTARQWAYALIYDPATARASLEDKADQFSAIASRFGVELDEQTLMNLADAAIRFDWEDDEIARSITNLIRSGVAKPTRTGSIAANQQMIRATVGQYLVSMDPQTQQDFALRLAEGSIDESAISMWALEHARARWNHLEHIWDKGITPEEYFAPIRNRVAELLEMNVSDVDLMDERFADLTEMVDENGNVRSMTVSEAGRWARTREEFKTTDTYRNTSATFADELQRIFGN